MRTRSKRTGQFILWLLSTEIDALLTLMDGRLEEVMDMAGQQTEVGTAVYPTDSTLMLLNKFTCLTVVR